jgi:hypothetical protein
MTQSLGAFIGNISVLTKRFNIILKEIYLNYDDAAFYDKNTKCFIIVGELMSLVNSFLGLPFNVGDKTAEELIQYITSPRNTRYTPVDFRDFEKNREKNF